MEEDGLDQASENLGHVHGDDLGNHLREAHLRLQHQRLDVEVIGELMEFLHNLEWGRDGHRKNDSYNDRYDSCLCVCVCVNVFVCMLVCVYLQPSLLSSMEKTVFNSAVSFQTKTNHPS